MLAGRMKLRNFIAVAAAFGVAAIVGGYVACDKAASNRVAAKPVATHAGDTAPAGKRLLAPPPPPTVAAPTPKVKVDGPNERAVDKAVMSWVGRDLGSKKRKDVAAGKPFKINVYQDAGETTANRAKVDLDRDGKWDEKWTFKPGEISRKVSSNDDDNYDKKQLWKDGAWADR